jgi:hypothetical protein
MMLKIIIKVLALCSKKAKLTCKNPGGLFFPMAHFFQSLSKQQKYVLFHEMFLNTTVCEHPSEDII